MALGPLFSDALSHVEAGELTLGQAPLPLFLWEPFFLSLPAHGSHEQTASTHGLGIQWFMGCFRNLGLAGE